MARFPILLPLFLLPVGCVRPAEAPQITPALANRVTSAAAEQVKRCYRGPRVPSAGRRIVTRLRVSFSPDGMLAATPELVSQQGVTPENRFYAGPMAQAASMAVIRCSPLRLPAELHRGGWDSFDLTFSPKVLV